MKVTKITITDDQGVEQVLDVKDGTLLLLCEEDKILTQVSTNAAINLEVMKQILAVSPQPAQTPQTPPVMAAQPGEVVPEGPSNVEEALG